MLCNYYYFRDNWNEKRKKYKQDTETIEKIKDYLKKEGIDGIEPSKIPKDIIKTGYLTWMLKDKTIVFKDGKYYLNKEK